MADSKDTPRNLTKDINIIDLILNQYSSDEKYSNNSNFANYSEENKHCK